MKTIGIDIGSSFIKASVHDAATGLCAGSSRRPETEMEISAPMPGWAEQSPETWWRHVKESVGLAIEASGTKKDEICAVGITYQMHGLVCIDKQGNCLRPSIIWCDSRAVELGKRAGQRLGSDFCLGHLLNSPGNFTAAKLNWVKENEPDVYRRIYKVMLPGDYIAWKLTGEARTTVSGLSEGVFWDFAKNQVSGELLAAMGIDRELLADVVDTFSDQGRLLPAVADELGLNTDVRVSYRAGDQPNNALSLNVLNPGEVAATAGTSGVVYGVSGQVKCDPLSRVNSFAHVNHSAQRPRLGVLLCINGTGILNSWLKKNVAGNADYERINAMAAEAPAGSAGLSVLPFGNGAERVLQNREIDCQIYGLNFNRHQVSHLLRAGQEGIAFAMKYGMDIMKQTGIDTSIIRAGQANMFLSGVFRQTLADAAGSAIELFDTDGAQGAAIGAAFGAGLYTDWATAFRGMKRTTAVEPSKDRNACSEAYDRWLALLERQLAQ